MTREEYYSCLAGRRSASRLELGSRHWEACRRLGHGRRFLEIGCGAGTVLREAARHYDEVHGVDIAISPLLTVDATGPVLHRVDLDSECLPYHGEHFDLVVCLDVIEHVFDPAHLLSETQRVLVRGGRAVFSTPNVRALRHMMTLAVQGRSPRTSNETVGFDGGHLHYFTSQDLRDLFHAAGFSEVKVGGLMTPSGRMAGLKRLLFPMRNVRPIREFVAGGLIVEAIRGWGGAC